MGVPREGEVIKTRGGGASAPPPLLLFGCTWDWVEWRGRSPVGAGGSARPMREDISMARAGGDVHLAMVATLTGQSRAHMLRPCFDGWMSGLEAAGAAN